MRKLASIQKIVDIKPIEGYDRVEYAIILGWGVLVKKNEFKVGDKCVYIEIDSQVPSDNPAFEFLSKKKYRIKTLKMCGVVSQGIAFSLSSLGLDDLPIGTDVTDKLHITKYDPETEKENKLNSNNKKKSSKFHKYMLRFEWYRKLFRSTKEQRWPDWIFKTDEPRCISSGTYIMTNKGQVKIEDIVCEPDKYLVLSYNQLTKKNEFKKILNISIKKNMNNWVKIISDAGNELICTSDHKIFIDDLNAYRQCSNLNGNEKLKELA